MEIGSCVIDEDLKIDAEEVVATSATRGTHGGSFQPPHCPLEMYVSLSTCKGSEMETTYIT